MAMKQISGVRDSFTNANRLRAAHQKANSEALKKEQEYEGQKGKKEVWQKRKQESSEMLRHKKMLDAQVRLRNSERAVAVQRQQLEAKLKINHLRAERLEQMKVSQDIARRDAQDQVAYVEQTLPMLEAEELLCVQRLQNSRIVTQSVLQELEQSLGARSPVTSLLRSKAQQRSINLGESTLDEGESFNPPPRA